jgi:hypothetical protein
MNKYNLILADVIKNGGDVIKAIENAYFYNICYRESTPEIMNEIREYMN